jgi:hypothetical protein
MAQGQPHTWPKSDDESVLLEDAGRNGVDDIEFFDVVAQSTPTRKFKHKDKSQDFTLQVTSTPVASRVEEEDSIFSELEAEIDVSCSNKCMQRSLIKGAALDLVPGSSGGLNVLLYFRLSNGKLYRNMEVLALCHRLQGSSSALLSSANSIFEFFEDSALLKIIWPWMRFFSFSTSRQCFKIPLFLSYHVFGILLNRLATLSQTSIFNDCHLFSQSSPAFVCFWSRQ